MNGSSDAEQTRIEVLDYDLEATLEGGQAFRWRKTNAGWEGVVAGRWVRLSAHPTGVDAVAAASGDWTWLQHYLQSDLNLDAVFAQFPDDAPLRAAVAQFRGLRLLRQEPWECLASYICSSTKQIPQIRQCIENLAAAFGPPAAIPPGCGEPRAFPSPESVAAAGVDALRRCKLGYRAPYLHAAAAAVADGRVDLDALRRLDTGSARDALMSLPGVGPKVADCVLLFAYGRQDAFPVDVWVEEALRKFYFPRRRPRTSALRGFASQHFGPMAGYAQQYLFHYARKLASVDGRRPLTRALAAME
jgi:N-glycosylase/DNA lyase